MMEYEAVWKASEPYLRSRRNDVHVPVVYIYAERLVAATPECDRDIVLLAALLHDNGWAMVNQEEIYTTAFKQDITDVRIQHEKEGARLAREILTEAGYAQALIDEIVEMIDGHDTRLEALSLNDSLMKDADKLWRYNPIGIAISADWHGMSPAEYIAKVETKDIERIFTDTARQVALEELDKSKALYRIGVL